MLLRDAVNPYLAARDALLIKHGTIPAGSCVGMPVAEVVRAVGFPGLGTGVGPVSPDVCAHQFRTAFEEIVLGQSEYPSTWAEAQMRHQRLDTDRPRNLQRG